MLILDRHRALDFLIAASTRTAVPEPFIRLPEPVSIGEPEIAMEPRPEALPAPEPAPRPVLASLLAEPPARQDGHERAGLFAAWWRGVRSPVAWSG